MPDGKIKIIDFDTERLEIPKFVGELICVSCFFRENMIWEKSTLLKDLDCPGCGKVGTMISTGQVQEF